MYTSSDLPCILNIESHKNFHQQHAEPDHIMLVVWRERDMMRLHLLSQQPAEPRGAPADQDVLCCKAADARAPKQGDKRAPPRVLAKSSLSVCA